MAKDFQGTLVHLHSPLLVQCLGKNPKCAMVKSRYIWDGHPTFNRNPYNWYIKPYYWVDDHPLLYGNNGSLDPSTSDAWNSGRLRW